MLFDRARFAINERCVAKAARVGSEPHHEVLIIDDFYSDPEYVRALALSVHYPDRGRLPKRSEVTLDVGPILGTVRRLVHPKLEVVKEYNAFVFSVMDENAPASLRHYPHPHADSVGKGNASLSAIIYLNLPAQCRGGTGFYRHIETDVSEHRGELTPGLASYMLKHGLASVNDAYERMSHVSPELVAKNAQATEEWGYLTDSNEEWELKKLVEMRFNRCIVFDSHLFHNPYLRSGDFGDTLETRRLTQTMFFELPEHAA